MPQKTPISRPLGKDAAKPKGKPRGRNGGRKPSVATARSKRIAEEIAAGTRYLLEDGDPLPADATPLDIMLGAMRKAYRDKGFDAAFPYAEKTAPYIHARIAQMTLKGDTTAPLRLLFAWAGEEAPAEADTDGI
jgi:hypothetical protein